MDGKSLRRMFFASTGCVLLAACALVSSAEEPVARQSRFGNTSTSSAGRLESSARPSGHVGSALYAAQQHIDFAQDLAERGAVHAAEEEFTKALWVMAQARQLEDPKLSCTRSLATALIALEEAEDFSPSVAATALEPDLRMVAVGHRTPVLRELSDETPITALGAIQRYYNYARQHLTTALGNEPSASRALYGLGRLQAALPSEGPVGNRFAQAKAMMMHLAAVQVDSKNFESANELGVLLARYGRPAEAKKALLQSLEVSPTAIAWHNLSKVCETLGDQRTAEYAQRQHAALAKQQESSLPLASAIRWVTPASFAAAGDLPAGVETNISTPVSSKQPPPTTAKASKSPWHKKLIDNLFSKDDDKQETPRATYVGRAGRGIRK